MPHEWATPPLVAKCRGAGKVWQPLNSGRLLRVPNNLIRSGDVHGQLAERWLGVHSTWFHTSGPGPIDRVRAAAAGAGGATLSM